MVMELFWKLTMRTICLRRSVVAAGRRQEVVAVLLMRVPTDMRLSFDQTTGHPGGGPSRKRNVYGREYMEDRLRMAEYCTVPAMEYGSCGQEEVMTSP